MRTTGVRLIAETSQYKREMRESAKATRGVKDEVDSVKTSSDKLGEGLAQTARDGRGHFGQMRRDAAALDEQIRVTENGLKLLAHTFASTGDVGILKQFKAQQRELSNLKGFRKQFGDLGAESAGAFAELFGKTLVPGLRAVSANPQIAAAVVGVGLVAAPALGAMVAGAIVGSVGVGGVVGGLYLASKDARVKSAVEGLGERLEARLDKAGGAFVQPALDGLHELETAIDGIDLEQILADSSELVPLLTQGIARALTALGNGISKLVASAGPSVKAIGEGIAQIGQSIGTGLALLSDNGKSAGDALRLLFGLINSSVQGVFVVVNALTELWEIAEKLGADRGLAVWLKLTGMGMEDNAQKAGQLSTSERIVREESERLAKAQEDLAGQQKLVSAAQQGLEATTQQLIGKQAGATLAANTLKTAMDGLYGAAIRQTDANEGYEASWDDLTASVKRNKASLDIHTAAGRANRDAMQALLTKSNEMYLADINAGVAIDAARVKHEKRTARIKEEARQLGLNKDQTKKLIETYGQIPKDKTTKLLLNGVNEVVKALQGLYLYQRALATGKPVRDVAYEVAHEKGMPKGFNGPIVADNGQGFAAGGWTGPGHKHTPAGVVHADEYVIQKDSRRKIEKKHPGLLDEMNATGTVGYAAGGLVAPVDTARRWPFVTSVAGTRIPSKAAVASKVTVAFSGDWPSSPSAQRGDSGVWRSIVRLIRSTGPLSGSFGNAYRPGDPLWHGSGRAVDWMGYNQDALATFLANRRPLELIHRTNKRDYAYTRGRNKGSFNEGLMNAHRNHIHIAMANGGMIREPVVGVGASGATYSFGERGVPERVYPMSGPGSGSGGSGATITINFSGPIGSRYELRQWLTGEIDDLKRNGRI